jgi:hypothetical protein
VEQPKMMPSATANMSQPAPSTNPRSTDGLGVHRGVGMRKVPSELG